MEQKKEDPSRQELVFALIGAAGVRLDDLGKALSQQLATFNYIAIDVRLSDLLKNFTSWTEDSKVEKYQEYIRIVHRQKMARELRRAATDAAVLARAAIAAIREQRIRITGNPDIPALGHAYVLRQLKHPREVELLRSVYGLNLYVLGGHATEGVRVDALAQRIAYVDGRSVDGSDKSKAQEVIHIDDKQDDDPDFGQNTREAYPLADFFANLGMEHGENSIGRFLELIFGHPFHSPMPDEVAMYQANSLSLRSSDERRQVGAVIVNQVQDTSGKIRNADIVASGMNEVPRRGGGFYWHLDSPDLRDQWLQANQSVDRERTIKLNALMELIERIRDKAWLRDEFLAKAKHDLAADLLPHLKGTQLMDISEFMRQVHAEMAALIDAARRGVAVDDLTMYVTTFPCHNCAKHIIAAGLKRVIYLEPYPKSKAKILHGEEMDLDSIDGVPRDERVVFVAFAGVAPRQYSRLFSMSARGAKRGGSMKEWSASRASLAPRYVPRNAGDAYVASEREELHRLPLAKYKWDKSAICPE